VIKKPSVLGSKSGLDHVVRNFVQRNFVVQQDAAFAEWVSEPIKKAHGKIGGGSPVRALGCLEGRLSEGEYNEETKGAVGQAFRSKAGDVFGWSAQRKAAHESGVLAKENAQKLGGVPQSRIQPGIGCKHALG